MARGRRAAPVTDADLSTSLTLQVCQRGPLALPRAERLLRMRRARRRKTRWLEGFFVQARPDLAELRQFAGTRDAGKLRTFLTDADVPDPFGGPYDAFRDCVARIRRGAVAYLPEHGA